MKETVFTKTAQVISYRRTSKRAQPVLCETTACKYSTINSTIHMFPNAQAMRVLTQHARHQVQTKPTQLVTQIIKSLSIALKGWAFTHKRERKLSKQIVQILSEAITIFYMCNLVLYINKVCYKPRGYSWQADAKTPNRSIALSPTVRWSLEVLKTHNILQVHGTTVHARRESRNRSISARFTRFTERLYTANRKFEVKDLIQFIGIR